MKIIKILFALATFPLFSSAQNITGDWFGTLKVQAGISIRIVFHITKTPNGFSSTMDSPDQGAHGIPVPSTAFNNPTLKLEIPAAKIVYTGELKDSKISGIFNQNGLSIPLNLSRTPETTILKRPQEPVKPYPYYSEEVSFKNDKANVTLAGTLTLPKKAGKFPAVILITGSGAQNRDEEMLGHKPFLVISDYLTRNGIAVLRYDDRGTAKSTGDFHSGTTADFATDAESAFAYLQTRKEINAKEIGLIGHSEGGTIAPIVASRNKNIAFIVMLAGPGMQGNQLILLQKEKIDRMSKIPDSTIAKEKLILNNAYNIVMKSFSSDTTLRLKILNFLKSQYGNDLSESTANYMTTFIVNPWFIYFLKLNPIPYLEKLNCPVLAMNGGIDLQVPAKENLEAIEAALKQGGNKNVTIKEFPGLNHLFQESATGLPSEYAKIEQTFSPKVLQYMTEWIKKQVD